MAPDTPYSKYLGDREPVGSLRESTARIRSLAAGWSTAQFERTYAPGKWPARVILTHLAQCELAFGTRVRMALTTPNYVAQSFDQDKWLVHESTMDGRKALDTFLLVADMNIALYAALSAADRATAFTHPDFGPQTVDWIIHLVAGHMLNHVQQLEQIASQPAGTTATA